MRIIAQHGFGPKDKLQRGLSEGIIDGVIFSPRYSKPDRIRQEIATLEGHGAVLALDPEYYATNFLSHPNPNLGSLQEWGYFQRPRRSSLISGAAIPSLIEGALSEQIALGVNRLISPNLYIQSADSIDAAIAINFLSRTKEVASELGELPVYGTLALHRDALLAGETFRDILDGLTGIENPPDGYYLIVGSSEQQSTGTYVRSDLSHPEVIAASMYVNYALSINGSHVINGYSFLLSPLMGICGAEEAASGWTSGLRKFCFDRYARSQQGGRQPNVRYLSNPLLSHVRQTDLDAFREIVPEVMNALPSDEVYLGEEPTRTHEALQSWEALRELSSGIASEGGDVGAKLEAFSRRIATARGLWERLRSAGFSNEVEPNIERLEAMEGGIEIFTEWAEI